MGAHAQAYAALEIEYIQSWTTVADPHYDQIHGSSDTVSLTEANRIEIRQHLQTPLVGSGF